MNKINPQVTLAWRSQVPRRRPRLCKDSMVLCYLEEPSAYRFWADAKSVKCIVLNTLGTTRRSISPLLHCHIILTSVSEYSIKKLSSTGTKSLFSLIKVKRYFLRRKTLGIVCWPQPCSEVRSLVDRKKPFTSPESCSRACLPKQPPCLWSSSPLISGNCTSL